MEECRRSLVEIYKLVRKGGTFESEFKQKMEECRRSLVEQVGNNWRLNRAFWVKKNIV
jgi:hypothetical protein